MEPRGCCCCSFAQLSHCHDTTLTPLTHIFFFLSSLLIKTTTMMMVTAIIICIHGCTLAALWSFFSATTSTTTTCCCLYYIFGERQTADTVGHLAVLCHRNPVCVVLYWESHPWDNHRPVIHFFDLYHGFTTLTITAIFEACFRWTWTATLIVQQLIDYTYWQRHTQPAEIEIRLECSAKSQHNWVFLSFSSSLILN